MLDETNTPPQVETENAEHHGFGMWLLLLVGVLLIVAGAYAYLYVFNTSETPMAPVESEPVQEEVTTSEIVPLTNEERETIYQNLVAQSVDTNTLDLTNCEPDPFVVAIDAGEELQIINNGTELVEMIFHEDRAYPVSPGSTETITIDPEEGLGLFEYSCTTNALTVGVLLVSEPDVIEVTQ